MVTILFAIMPFYIPDESGWHNVSQEMLSSITMARA